MTANTLKTELDDRTLCGDGDSIVSMKFLYQYILDGGLASDVFVSSDDLGTDEVIQYNARFKKDQVTSQDTLSELSTAWDIPDRYGEINIHNHIIDCLKREVSDFDLTDDEIKVRYYRVKMELRIWAERGIMDLLRTLIYVVDTFEDKKVIWGTGRGSSCASYLLYLIGLHQVDSVEYDLDIGEFLR